ncbi:MAG: tRNA pseudouridine(55) synthase TruB [Deltaproteobacteria bacterium]|nr:tRNA pseudouridine(55) synthase TruB [Deltaproteobacteria bacterium]
MSSATTKTFHGFLALDKALKISSHQALSVFKRKLPKIKIGHTGTLDPLATGLLVVAVGEATKLISYLSEKEKVYQAQASLGTSTTTDDSEGEVLESRSFSPLEKKNLQKALESFLGKSLQIPPLYSAIKSKGRALYHYARAGKAVKVSPREIEIFKIKLLDFKGAKIDFEVTCSRGTYIRALVRDLGERLGTLAHLSALRRISSGQFSLDQAWTGEAFEKHEVEDWPWIPMEQSLDLPQFSLDSSEDCERLKQGVRVEALQSKLKALKKGDEFAITDGVLLRAIGSFEEPLFRLKRVLRREP